jgi:hypothetical protein
VSLPGLAPVGKRRCQNGPMTDEKRTRRQLPPWVLGLIIAAVVFVVVILVMQALGFGDDPAIESGMDGLQIIL